MFIRPQAPYYTSGYQSYVVTKITKHTMVTKLTMVTKDTKLTMVTKLTVLTMVTMITMITNANKVLKRICYLIMVTMLSHLSTFICT